MSNQTPPSSTSLGSTKKPNPINGSGSISANSTPTFSYNRLLSSTRNLVLRAAEGLMSRIEAGRASAKTFGGQRKLDHSLGRLDRILPEHYAHRYERGGIAGTIIGKLPKDAWKSGATILENKDGKETTNWESDIANLFKNLNAWYVLREADILRRQQEYSIVVVGLSSNYGDSDKAVTSNNLNVDSILYLRPISQEFISVSDFEKDPSSSRFGWPNIYKITTDTKVTNKFHHSRIIHLTDSLFSPIGRPILKRLWDSLDDFDKEKGGIAESTYQNSKSGKVWEMADDLLFEADELSTDSSSAKLDDYDSTAKTITETLIKWRHDAIGDLVAGGFKPTDLNVKVPDGSSNIKTQMRIIAAESEEYPESILFGKETGVRAGNQDNAEYDLTKTNYRESECSRYTDLLIQWLINYKVIEEPTNGYRLEWPKIDKMSLRDKSSASAMISKANKNTFEVEGKPILTSDEIREDIYGKKPLEVEANPKPIEE